MRGAAVSRVRAVIALMFVFGAALLAGCAGPMPLRGEVLEAGTGRPVVGAVVLGIWTKTLWAPSQSRGQLVDVKETEVDDAGRFTLVRPDASYARESIFIHKAGYVAWSNYSTFPTFEQRDGSVPPQIMLEPFPAGDTRKLREQHEKWIDSYAWQGLYPKTRVPHFIESLGRDGIRW